jgi:hypothetical protein
MFLPSSVAPQYWNEQGRLTHGRFLVLFIHPPLHTQDNTTQEDEDKHLCLKRDSNTRSQRPSDQDLCLWPSTVFSSPRPPFHAPRSKLWQPGSSGSIVSGYGLDYREIEVRFLAEAKDFSSSLCIQTGSGAHPASCTVGTGCSLPGGNARPGRDADHSPPSSAEVENE